MLHSLINSNAALLKQVSLLSSGVSELSSQLARLAETSPLAPTASGPVLERHSGDPGACQAFLVQCSLVFELQPCTYSSERSRIAFVISLLIGRARDWGTAL